MGSLYHWRPILPKNMPLRFCRRHLTLCIRVASRREIKWSLSAFTFIATASPILALLRPSKNDPRLFRTLCPTNWQFWMQITRHQVEDGWSGFTFEAVIAEIKAKGYLRFTGSPKLLEKLAPIRRGEGPSNV